MAKYVGIRAGQRASREERKVGQGMTSAEEEIWRQLTRQLGKERDSSRERGSGGPGVARRTGSCTRMSQEGVEDCVWIEVRTVQRGWFVSWW